MKFAPSPITCQQCGSYLYERSGDTLTAGVFRLTLKVSHKIQCTKCGAYTRACVERRRKRVDNGVKASKM